MTTPLNEPFLASLATYEDGFLLIVVFVMILVFALLKVKIFYCGLFIVVLAQLRKGNKSNADNGHEANVSVSEKQTKASRGRHLSFGGSMRSFGCFIGGLVMLVDAVRVLPAATASAFEFAKPGLEHSELYRQVEPLLPEEPEEPIGSGRFNETVVAEAVQTLSPYKFQLSTERPHDEGTGIDLISVANDGSTMIRTEYGGILSITTNSFYTNVVGRKLKLIMASPQKGVATFQLN